MSHIILIGYRGTGKTSIGRKLAERMGLPFYDTDQLLIDHIGKTIKDWVEEKGWASFRKEEREIIQELPSRTPGIIAMGGGAVMTPEIRETIQPLGPIIWLTADLKTILKRMESDPQNQDNRPALSDKDLENEVKDLLAQRSPVYRQLSDFFVDTEGKTVEGVTEEIMSLIRTQRIGRVKGMKPQTQ